MQRRGLLTILVLLACVHSTAMHQGKLGHLRGWVGKYPTYIPIVRACVLTLLLGAAPVAAWAPSETTPPDTPAYSRRVWRSVDGLPEDFAQSLAQTPDGYLWIGTSGGVARFSGTPFVGFNRANTPAFLCCSRHS